MKISSGDSTSGPQAAVGLLNLSAHVPRGTLPGTGIITVSTLINVTRSALSELKTRDKPLQALPGTHSLFHVKQLQTAQNKFTNHFCI